MRQLPHLKSRLPLELHWPQIILSNTSLRYLSSMYAPSFHHMVAVRTCLSCPHLQECDWPWTSAAALKQGLLQPVTEHSRDTEAAADPREAPLRGDFG